MPAGKKSPRKPDPKRVRAGKRAAHTRALNASTKSPKKCRTVLVKRKIVVPRKVTRTVMSTRTVTTKRKTCKSPKKGRIICRRYSPRRSTNIGGRRVLRDDDPILSLQLDVSGDVIRTQESVDGRIMKIHTPVQYRQKSRLLITEGQDKMKRVMTSINYDARDDVSVLIPSNSQYYPNSAKRIENSMDVHLRLIDSAALGVRIPGIKGATIAINDALIKDTTIKGDTLRAYLSAVQRAYAKHPTAFRSPYIKDSFVIVEKNKVVNVTTM